MKNRSKYLIIIVTILVLIDYYVPNVADLINIIFRETQTIHWQILFTKTWYDWKNRLKTCPETYHLTFNIVQLAITDKQPLSRTQYPHNLRYSTCITVLLVLPLSSCISIIFEPAKWASIVKSWVFTSSLWLLLKPYLLIALKVLMTWPLSAKIPSDCVFKNNEIPHATSSLQCCSKPMR